MADPRQEKIAADRQHSMVPAMWQVEFQTWTDDALLSLVEDERASPDVRAYAGWELDYRQAFGKAPLPVKELPKADRSRWTMKGAEETIKRKMEEQRGD
jgi:hypothetical protein